MGDADGDGSVTSLDTLIILQYEAGFLVELELDTADVNQDGVVDSVDDQLILQLVAGLTDELPPT